jgi:hypothetical protein
MLTLELVLPILSGVEIAKYTEDRAEDLENYDMAMPLAAPAKGYVPGARLGITRPGFVCSASSAVSERRNLTYRLACSFPR